MNKREIWVDKVKIIACMLVVLDHIIKGVSSAGIINQGTMYFLIINTIHFFHVQLFFVCSGYLYQRTCKIRSVVSWKENVLKKLLVLGVPYISFSVFSLIVKCLFVTNNELTVGNIINTLLINPISPYWYLYALIIIFFVTPTFDSKKETNIALVISCTI